LMSAISGVISMYTSTRRVGSIAAITAAMTVAVGFLALSAGCERSNKEKIEDGARDIGSGISGAAKDAADAVTDGLEKADDKVGELVDD